MIKRFCDACGTEISRSANRDVWEIQFQNEDKKILVQIDCMVTINGTTNGGEICQACVVKTVRDGRKIE